MIYRISLEDIRRKIEDVLIYDKWIETLSMFALGEGDYFYSDEILKEMYLELCEDIKKADEKFEQEIVEVHLKIENL